MGPSPTPKLTAAAKPPAPSPSSGRDIGRAEIRHHQVELAVVVEIGHCDEGRRILGRDRKLRGAREVEPSPRLSRDNTETVVRAAVRRHQVEPAVVVEVAGS